MSTFLAVMDSGTLDDVQAYLDELQPGVGELSPTLMLELDKDDGYFNYGFYRLCDKRLE